MPCKQDETKSQGLHKPGFEETTQTIDQRHSGGAHTVDETTGRNHRATNEQGNLERLRDKYTQHLQGVAPLAKGGVKVDETMYSGPLNETMKIP